MLESLRINLTYRTKLLRIWEKEYLSEYDYNVIPENENLKFTTQEEPNFEENWYIFRLEDGFNMILQFQGCSITKNTQEDFVLSKTQGVITVYS